MDLGVPRSLKETLLLRKFSDNETEEYLQTILIVLAPNSTEQTQVTKINNLLKKYYEVKFSSLPKKRRDIKGNLVNEDKELHKLKIFNNPGKNAFKVNQNNNKSFKKEFEGLSARQLIDLMKNG